MKNNFFLSFFKFFSSFIFVISLSSFIVFWILFDFTSEKNLRPLLTHIFYDIINESMNNYNDIEIKNFLIDQCNIMKDFEVKLYNMEIKLSCDKIFDLNDTKKILAEGMFNSLYEKEYECRIDKCILESNFIFLISRKSNQIYKKYLIITLIMSIITGILFFVLENQNISVRLKNLGILIFLTSIPGIIFYFLFDFTKNRFIYYNSILDPLFENIKNIIFEKYLIIFTICISFFIASFLFWIILKIYSKNKL